ncbi:CheR family methyltransferase [Limnobacter parvus]|uniref:protein-glutamate O-methyltransferase n=1 Tax=Limnobacter parvus TaxID=2939690 RepID=A0ABT1XIN8_9BURK|nr:CheR family methyltransferase [Limnobacter parvus]MCR2746448.1 chemotaxis protein CheR [Limnobacter parvus]
MNRPPAKFEFSKAQYANDPVAGAKHAAAAVNKSLLTDDNAEREFEFNDKDFARVRALILKIAGISLAPSKQSMVYSRLARRLRACNHNRFSCYLDALEANASNPEWEHFTNSLTTNLTSFYREAHHFDILKKQLQSLSRNSRIELWCSAASTGEEPYTMAITAMEAFNSMNPPVRILATDIDTKVIDHAKKGVYRMDQVDKIPDDILRKYFLKGKGESEGLIRVRPEVQALLTFRKLNLMDNVWSLRPGFDAVFCRNVMIYFEKDVQLQILKRFAPLMNPNGLLYAGHSENFAMARDYFTLRGKTVYTVNTDKAAKTGAGGESKAQQVLA